MKPECMRCQREFEEKEQCLYIEGHRIIATEEDAPFQSAYDSTVPQPKTSLLCFSCVMTLNLEYYLEKKTL